jgi:hypothetical protein
MNNTEIESKARERLHALVLDALAEEGFERIDLAKILFATGVSEQNFDATYEDLEACAFAAYDEETARLDASVREACRAKGTAAAWPERVAGGLAALLAEFARRPSMARAVLHAFPAIGPRARARSQAFLESFGPLLAGGRAASGLGDRLPREVENLATGAAEALIFEEVVAGRAAALPALLPHLLFSVLVPFIGPERAADEMETAHRLTP